MMTRLFVVVRKAMRQPKDTIAAILRSAQQQVGRHELSWQARLLVKMSMKKMPRQKVVFMQDAPTRVERDVAMDGYVRLVA